MLLLKFLQNFTRKNGCVGALLILSMATLPLGRSYAQNSNTFENSVVMIMAVSQEYDFSTPWKKGPMGRGSGSGFIIDGNRILTNAHNVANQRYIEVKKQNLAKRYPAQVQFVGHDCDLALVSVIDPEFYENTQPLSFGPLPQINSTVQTCGFPMGGRQISITEGVVSRLETGVYSHSQASQHLVVQTDAAINPGNSGGPVFQDGKVVGVAFQGLTSGDNIGYMIPTTVIAHFLKDVEDGRYDGFGKFGVSLYPGLHNSHYKKYLKIPDEEDGVVVIDVLLNSTSYGKLQRGDVLTKIDDFNIDNDGRILIDGLTLELSEIMDRKQIGESAALTFYRDGEKQKQDLRVAANDPALPWNRQYDTKPDYRVFAGLTFVQLNRNFLETWGNSWIADLPFSLRYLFVESNQLNKNPDRKEYVVLSEILSDEVNAYLGGFKNQVVESVNGMAINKLEDLDRAFEKDENGFWVVKCIENDTPMVIDASKARMNQGLILKKYNVPMETQENEKQYLF
jgi:S1-C subfamily serine protease